MALEGVVAHARVEAPNLDGAVQGRAGKGVGVLGVDRNLHHVVVVPLEDLDVLPAAVPVPQLDEHVVRGREDVRQRRVDGDRPDVVGVRLKRRHLLVRVVVEHAHLHVVRTRHDPVLAGDKLARAHRQLRHLKRLHHRLWRSTPAPAPAPAPPPPPSFVRTHTTALALERSSVRRAAGRAPADAASIIPGCRSSKCTRCHCTGRSSPMAPTGESRRF